MNRMAVLVLAGLLGVAIVGVAGGLERARSQDAAPAPAATVTLVDDCTQPAGPAPCDGTPTTGTVEYRQEADGDVRLIVTLENARQSGEYPVLLNDCGSSAVTTCGTVLIGSVMTDSHGSGAGEIIIPLDTLRAAPFGLPGVHSARVTLVKPGAIGRHSRPGVLTAAGIAYTIP